MYHWASIQQDGRGSAAEIPTSTIFRETRGDGGCRIAGCSRYNPAPSVAISPISLKPDASPSDGDRGTVLPDEDHENHLVRRGCR